MYMHIYTNLHGTRFGFMSQLVRRGRGVRDIKRGREGGGEGEREGEGGRERGRERRASESAQCQKRPTLVSKETYTSVKRDLL
jgi:hypothetical protein